MRPDRDAGHEREPAASAPRLRLGVCNHADRGPVGSVSARSSRPRLPPCAVRAVLGAGGRARPSRYAGRVSVGRRRPSVAIVGLPGRRLARARSDGKASSPFANGNLGLSQNFGHLCRLFEYERPRPCFRSFPRPATQPRVSASSRHIPAGSGPWPGPRKQFTQDALLEHDPQITAWRHNHGSI